MALRVPLVSCVGGGSRRTARRSRWPALACSGDVGRFYLFMADHRHEAAELLGEPRWSELTDAHARLWRGGEMANRRRVAVRPGDYIEPDALEPDRRAIWTSSAAGAIRPRPCWSTASGADRRAAATRKRCARSAGGADRPADQRDPDDGPRAADRAPGDRPTSRDDPTRSSPVALPAVEDRRRAGHDPDRARRS